VSTERMSFGPNMSALWGPLSLGRHRVRDAPQFPMSWALPALPIGARRTFVHPCLEFLDECRVADRWGCPRFAIRPRARIECPLYKRLVFKVMQQVAQCAISVPRWIFELGAQLGAGQRQSRRTLPGHCSRRQGPKRRGWTRCCRVDGTWNTSLGIVCGPVARRTALKWRSHPGSIRSNISANHSVIVRMAVVALAGIVLGVTHEGGQLGTHGMAIDTSWRGQNRIDSAPRRCPTARRLRWWCAALKLVGTTVEDVGL
jgi:hypothetical protein